MPSLLTGNALSRRRSAIDLNGVITGMELELRRLLAGNTELVFLPAPQLGRVIADVGEIERTLLSLAINAREAIRGGGAMGVETENVSFGAPWAHRHGVVHAGEYVKLSVSDTGCGMSPETQASCFLPFYTTKERGRGAGLATVYGLVRQSGGHVTVQSEVCEGATFSIYLPRIAAAQ